MIGLLTDLIVGILISLFMFVSLSLIRTMALASIPATVQATSIGLLILQQTNQTYGEDSSMQIAILQAKNAILEIHNLQISTAIQNVNEIERIFDYFHNLSSINDFLEIL